MSLLLLDEEVVRPPVDPSSMTSRPRLGCSIASIVLKRTYPIREIAKIYSDCGVGWTSVNLLSAEWPSMRPVHVRPFRSVPDGRPWNLYDWNHEHFDRIDECAYEMNSRGIVVQWCYEDLYRWSIRKAGSGTPDARLGPFAKAWNTNGVDYVGPYYPDKTSDASKRWDSTMLAHTLPDAWAKAYIKRAIAHLSLQFNYFLIGNELPEKSLHQRIRSVVLAENPFARVSVNRNEDTPGQYINMKIGREFDHINFHGRNLKRPSDLDKLVAGNTNFPTFRALLERPFISSEDKNSVQQWRITFSSDGAGVEAYNYVDLDAFAKEVFGYGASFEHQSVVKLDGDIRKIETGFLTKLATYVH